MATVRIYSAEISRRAMLQGAAAAAVGVAVISEAQAAKPKRTQADVAYQDHPKGGERCDNCAPFIPPDGCKTVEGKVAAAGWCKIYVEK